MLNGRSTAMADEALTATVELSDAACDRAVGADVGDDRARHCACALVQAWCAPGPQFQVVSLRSPNVCRAIEHEDCYRVAAEGRMPWRWPAYISSPETVTALWS